MEHEVNSDRCASCADLNYSFSEGEGVKLECQSDNSMRQKALRIARRCYSYHSAAVAAQVAENGQSCSSSSDGAAVVGGPDAHTERHR